ncbi:hypothetical protein [Alkalihalobacillus sp. TS-13]|uniref:hypothetical protein n=1 Tax=Alkalihalobacillus sp. TS-13 TaxID=2842455 RepID=UPI001C86FA2F|nr:hypothetical protein [Alkalihalobacillus sp. TS-13]
MKKPLMLVFLLLMLFGCGKDLDFDQEKMEAAVREEAMTFNKVKEGGYKAEDIEIVSICKAERNTSKDVPQHYFVHWQTKDGKVKDENTLMKEYEQDGADDFYTKTNECVEY